jgi:hypothetical protein
VRSDQLIQICQSMTMVDLLNAQSVIKFFLTHNCGGGWEGWLQVAYAHAVYVAGGNGQFDREVVYPGSPGYRCDLWFKDYKGSDMWVELKTQRNHSYTNTVNDFNADIKKINSLDARFRKDNVLVAFAIMALQGTDGQKLGTLRLLGDRFNVWQWTSPKWTNVTLNIATVAPGQIVLATYRAV